MQHRRANGGLTHGVPERPPPLIRA
jgi:hypothetical protein